MDVNERLAKRFRNVSSVTPADIDDWVAEAEAESGLETGVSVREDNALLYLAYAIGCSVIATDAARYFKYTDAEEAVDKTMIAAQYMKLAAEARKQYTRQLNGGFGASMSTPARADGR
ncbi:hypothetical protein KQR54_18320 [Mycobacterium gordonae]|nr:hypothetical protein [Mycobacterium gordonae]